MITPTQLKRLERARDELKMASYWLQVAATGSDEERRTEYLARYERAVEEYRAAFFDTQIKRR